MYKTSKETQERKDAKRQFILETAAKVFAEKGYHNTSVKDIVATASISVGSFYFYFKSKEELFAELYISIIKKFQQSADQVLDVENFSLAKNFTRVIMSNLWMYETYKDLANLMLNQVSAINPEFDKVRNESINESCRNMVGWFQRIKKNNPVNIPDERLAALIFEGTFHHLINDWLSSNQTTRLVDTGYALCIYNLQALRIPFEDVEVKEYIREVLQEFEDGKYK